MGWGTLLSCFLIFVGAIVMLRSIIHHKRLMDVIKEFTSGFSHRTSILVRAHMCFMLFFFLAYLAVIYFFVAKIDVIGNLFVGLIFMFGAIFVYIGIRIQRKSVELLIASNSELRNHAEELEAKQKEVINLYEDLKFEIEQKERAQESEQIKSDFLSQVSHELRTPLTSIFGFIKLIDKDFSSCISGIDIAPPLDKKQDRIKKNISIISSECARLTRMINNVLDLAKIESGESTWNNAPIELSDIVDSSLTAVEGLILEKGTVRIDSKLSPNLPAIVADADLITQVLINLLSNAIKFSDSGTVTIRVMYENSYISIAVSDEGVGIPPEDIERIFDRYFISRKGDTLKTPRLGTGLGLPICKQIVEHYGGQISAQSELGVGSTVQMTLPNSIVHK